MDAALAVHLRHPVGPWAVRFLIGLLYCTGLRINEALKLNLGDVDLDCGTLFVRYGKFGKDRLVVMTHGTLEALQDWLELRSRYAGTERSAPLLLGGINSRLTYWQAKRAFKTVCQRCGLHDRPPPRFHDLRHNFACRCIARWRETGKDVQALLPVLANAMGHVDIFATQLYIHVDGAALQQASTVLRDHLKHPRENG
jgi:integrase/recombinase XerD